MTHAFKMPHMPPAHDYFLDVVTVNCLEQIVTAPTRNKSFLDLLYINNAAIVDHVEIREPLGTSDHNSVFARLNVPLFFSKLRRVPNHCPNVNTNCRFNFSKADWDLFRHSLAASVSFQSGSDRNFDHNSIENHWLSIKSDLIHCAKCSIPFRRKTNINAHFTNDPEVKKALIKKYAVYKKYKNSHNTAHLQIIRAAQTKVKRVIRKAKIAIENKISAAVSGNPKIFWNHVRSRLKAPTTVTYVLDNDGNLTSDDFQTSCALNKFFASVFTTEQAGPLPSLTHTDGVIPEARLSAFSITREDVSNVIHRLNANSSPGPDNIPNRLLIESRDVILPSITRFFNNLLRSGTIPNDWKNLILSLFIKRDL